MERQGFTPETSKSDNVYDAIEAIRHYRFLLNAYSRQKLSDDERTEEAGRYYDQHVRGAFTDGAILTAHFILDPPDQKYFPGES